MINKEKMIQYLRSTEFNALEFSKDDSTKVCATILDKDDFTPKTWGYNGIPRGANEDIAERWERPEKYKWVEHAERNAIANAAKVGTALDGSCLVVNMFPCIECARMIVQSGIKDVVTIEPNFALERDLRWREDYERSQQLFKECGVNLHLIAEHDARLQPIKDMFAQDEYYLGKQMRKIEQRKKRNIETTDNNSSNNNGLIRTIKMK